jgi:hypothetical protein
MVFVTCCFFVVHHLGCHLGWYLVISFFVFIYVVIWLVITVVIFCCQLLMPCGFSSGLSLGLSSVSHIKLSSGVLNCCHLRLSSMLPSSVVICHLVFDLAGRASGAIVLLEFFCKGNMKKLLKIQKSCIVKRTVKKIYTFLQISQEPVGIS